MTTNWQIGEFLPYERRNRWQIDRILGGPGSSGMGIVYIVYDHEWHLPFAAKTFQDVVFACNPVIADRFREESLAWINLELHQNIAQACFVEQIGGKPFLFLEYVSGGDLGAWIGTPRLVKDLAQVLRFAIQFCDGMNHVLARGIVAHRDIKPQNCLITKDRTLKVTDFGMAKMLGDISFEKPSEPNSKKLLPMGLTRTGTAAGTPTHMAPEQFNDAKHVDLRADIYSFGVMVFQMVTGRLPFLGESWQDFEHLHKTQLPPCVGDSKSAVLDSILQKCLAKKPECRFANFEEIRRQLTEMYQELTGEVAPRQVGTTQLTEGQWSNKGSALSALGRKAEAIACYDRAVELNANYPNAWYGKGNALAALGRTAEAIACYDQALELEPNWEQAWTNKGVAFGALGRAEEEIYCYDHALRLNPHHSWAWYNKGNALDALGRRAEAIACYDHSLELTPNLEEAWNNKGVALQALGRTAEAITCFDRALHLNKRHASTWNNKGTALDSLGQTVEAIACYDDALEINPNLEQTWTNKGLALHRLGQTAEAIACYDHALQLNAGDATVWQSRGVAMSALGRAQEAITCYDRALRLNPHYAYAWACRGAGLNELGRTAEAIASYDHALEIDPNSEEVWYNKGTVLFNSGSYEIAMMCFEESQRLGFQEARQAIALCRQMLAK